MKQTERSHDLLVLEDRPWLIGGFIWLMSIAALYAVLTGGTDGPAETLLVAFLGLGGSAVAWWYFPFQTFEFRRTAGLMTRTIRRLGNTRVETLAFSDFSRAANQGHFSDSGTRMDRVVLLTDNGPYPLEFGFVGASRDPLVASINAWLEA
ncbi:MAG: hypothetical protein HKN18_16090 [Silicimonas sp.]|nr:hypothetical protein [Silicimonas sp.]